MDLRDPCARGAEDEEILGLIAGIWHGREHRYSETRSLLGARGNGEWVEIFRVGG